MNLPLLKVKLLASPDDTIYKKAMMETLSSLKVQGVTAAAYGDIFLEDLRVYRTAVRANKHERVIPPVEKRH